MLFPPQALGTIREFSNGEVWDSDRIADAVARAASTLRKKGIGPGDNVLIYHGGSGAFFADLFAVWEMGACAACLNPGLSQPELENIVAFIKPKLILVDQDTVAATAGGVDMLCARNEPGEHIVENRPALANSNLDDAALILFTSGTTGTPKGVVHNFRSLLARVNLNRQFIGDTNLRRTLCVLPTHFGHGLIGNCLTPLLFGHELLLLSGGSLPTISKLGEIIDQHEISFMSSVPSFWKLVCKLAKPAAKDTLRRVQIGSAPLAADLWRQVIEWCGTDDVVNMYGITETANWLAGASARDLAPEDGLIGRMWGGAAAIMNADGQFLPHGEGELVVQSPSLMSGYYQLEAQTEEVLVDGWFRTGDIGRIDEDGVMRLTGRQKNEINRAGIKVHPEDLDLLFERHEAVSEACAFGIADDLSNELVGLALSLVDGTDITLAEIRTWCDGQLALEKRPDKWFIVPEIPKTDRGKINRQRVAEYCFQLNADEKS
jgi:oxalate---CoA ligase